MAGWGLWGPRRSRLSSGDIWEGWRRALPLGFQKLLEECSKQEPGKHVLLQPEGSRGNGH